MIFCVELGMSQDRILLDYRRYNIPTFSATSSPGFGINIFGLFKFKPESEDGFRNIGFYGSRLRTYLKEDEEAIKHLNKFSNKRITSTFLCVAALSSIIIYSMSRTTAIQANPSQRPMLNNNYLLSISFGSLVGNWLFRLWSKKDIRKAVSLYNVNLLNKEESRRGRRTQFSIGLSSNNIGSENKLKPLFGFSHIF